MALPIFQRTVVDNAGNIIAGATVTVLLESTGLAANIYSDRAGAAALSNPFTTGSDGLARFYAAPGEYRIQVSGPSTSADWRYQILGGTASTYDVTESTTDTSTGGNGQKRSLKVGDAGVLETGNQGGGFDFDVESVTRIVAFSGGSAAANGKPFDAWGVNLTFTNNSFPDIKQQLFIGNSGSTGSSDMRALFRTMPNNGVYNGWVEMLSTNRAGSIDPETSTTDTTSFNHTATGAVQSIRSAGVEVGSITVTGSATSYNTSSDHRLKEDWKVIENASDRLLSLKPVNFKWKSSEDRADGFLAHELQAVIPEAVTGEKDETELIISTDEEGNEIETEVPKHQAIDQSKIVPLLTAALQEALKRIEALENK